MHDIKFTCVGCTISTHTYEYIIITYIRSLIDLLEIGKRTQNPKHLLAHSDASASFVRIFASFTPHKRIVHPLSASTQTVFCKRRAKPEHMKNMLFIRTVYCVRHIIYAYYCCAEIRYVCISLSPRLILYTHIYI